MTDEYSDTTDAESIENSHSESNRDNETGDDGSKGFPLSRRETLLTGVGLGGLSLLGSQSASGDHRHPTTGWNRHQSAQGEYTLVELAGLNMAVMPHEQNLEDFEGSGLQIEKEDELNKLTVNFDEAGLDRRYLSWNNDAKALDFTGAAEWENEVDDFDESETPNLASGTGSVAAGGSDNDATGDYSTVAGGEANNAGGRHSFAAGEGADASDDGSFVWATGGDSSRGADSVHFQAPGGASVAGGDLDVEDGNVGAEHDVTARTGDVSADSGNVTADSGNVTAGNVTLSPTNEGWVVAEQTIKSRHGDVIADNASVFADAHVVAKTGNVVARDGNVVVRNGDVLAEDGDIEANNGDVLGENIRASNDVEVDGDLHVTGTKHFVTAVDTPTGAKQVAYTSVEAGKPRTEASDVAELSDGRAVIELPEHFAMVTSEEEPLSVQVTPYASEQVHPQVVERGLDRIVVEDVGDGPDEYALAYTVKGVRDGYEDTPVVRGG